MTLRDMVGVSLGNLRRMKLRTILTASGILIAIAAFISMLSFGAGTQRNIEKQFDELGLLTTIQVYPKGTGTRTDSSHAPLLDDAAIARIAGIPGVKLVYPYDAFDVRVRIGDSVMNAKAQALSVSALGTRLFSRLAAGSGFDSGYAHETMISAEFLKKAGVAHPDSILGKKIVVSVFVSTLDSAMAHLLVDHGESLIERAKRIRLDSLRRAPYRSKILRQEGNEVVRRFVNGFLTARREIAETLTVCGVRPLTDGPGRLRMEAVTIPVTAAARFRAGGFSGNPVDIFSAMTQGALFTDPSDGAGSTYPQVTIDFNPNVFYKSIADSVERMGYRTFSFASNFEQMQKAFMYLDFALGLIGLIALTTASLGIINTMIMSISERRREIGILKSLGADDRDINFLFLTESAVIGLLGTAAGIVVGWLIARTASLIAQEFMKRQGVPPVDLFAMPYWLLLIAVSVGLLVSVLAGYYPARRAARVDPVEALRNE